ncbi:ribonuclease P protein component [Frondihabitans cladoniiphilus]|uniref:Ribonuclease P protein component n=1 Tax=Frondihabitans cladoniiphilus TaxID=715785 RepID=A0ABP8VZC3_9MICO
MLARANRIVRADDYRNTVRRGRKTATAHCVVYVRSAAPAASSKPESVHPARFGFIVSKAVGNAVTRNTVRRRLKAIAHTSLVSGGASTFPSGTDVVIRALPGALDVPWPILLEEISKVMDKGVKA